MRTRVKPTLLIISQVYVPDPASVGQHMADVAVEMARRGYHVVIYASRRGYEDPTCKYPKREWLRGVDVRRLPLSSFGKASIPLRLLGGIAFLLQVVVRALFLAPLDGVMISTSPPMCSVAALVISLLRRVPITYWVMDINPDQAVALGRVRRHSMAVRLFDLLNCAILKHSRRVVTLDRFMAARLGRKHPLGQRLAVMPPWPHEDAIAPIPHEQNPFRQRHGLDGKLVFMYSGNMSPAHPLDTILQATLRLQKEPQLVFLFIGGGLARQQVQTFLDRHQPPNVRLLPYQPLAQVRYSLSAADVHLVSMGDDMVGIVHPCKVYGAMACARPVLLVGPQTSHLGELIQEYQIGWQVEHGDVDGLVATIERILKTDYAALEAIGAQARRAIDGTLGKKEGCRRFCDEIEASLPGEVRLAARLAPTFPGVATAKAQPRAATIALAPASATTPLPPVGKVLILGDDPFITLPVRRAFRQIMAPGSLGLAARGLGDGAELFRLLQTIQPTLIVAILPPLRGPDDEHGDDALLACIRQSPRWGVESLLLLDHGSTHPCASLSPGDRAEILREVPQELPTAAKHRRLERLRAAAKRYLPRAAALLIENPYGPRDDFEIPFGSLIPAVIREVTAARDAGKSRVDLPWTADQTDGFVFVRDAGRAATWAAASAPDDQVVSLRSTERVTFAALAEMICRMSGFPGQLAWQSAPVSVAAGRDQEPAGGPPPIPLASPTPLRDAIIETIAWYERHRDRRSPTAGVTALDHSLLHADGGTDPHVHKPKRAR